ncbi:tubulinyl-Tyr carboxypeptidase 1 [Aplysia californica]|uniref:Tubulinyl-Tyr carboxypeptidase 1 n=1 Tax=Aplysia californica TaxID=6500 RepID=A0ABM0JB75_APLCA|nr:tubulinyl-Tyr carboxypeptidase 1 [Aplysia californica]
MKSAAKVLGLKEKDETHEENGVLFWVNKSGFPIDEQTWERMWDHVAKIHPNGHDMVRKVRHGKDLPQIPAPQAPLSFSPTLSIPERLKKIQDYMKELQYNHTGTQFFEIRKNRPVSGLMECAREMIREALPIKCLEAVILGIFLTNGMLGVERFALSFKTVFKGHIHRHVVLGISHGGYYGAIGMSRREDLMYKPMEFKSLAELVFDFERCYMKYWHSVKKVKVGLPVIHDQHSYEVINWKALMVSFSKSDRKELTRDLDSHARRMKSLSKSWTSGPYAALKMLNTAEATRDLQPTMEGRASPTRLRRSQTLAPQSPMAVRQRSSVGSSDVDYQIRI